MLSDIELAGGLDGIALAMLLSRRRPSLPVVLMSGYSQRLDQAFDAHLEVLPKPVSAAMLASVLDRALESRHRTLTSQA